MLFSLGVGQLIRVLLVSVVSFGLTLLGQPGRVYADVRGVRDSGTNMLLGVNMESQRVGTVGESYLVIAQSGAVSPSVSPSNTSSPKVSVSPSPVKSPSGQQGGGLVKTSETSIKGLNPLMFLLVLEGVVFLFFKGFEVFGNQRKMALIWEKVSEQIAKLSSIPDDIKGLIQSFKEMKDQQEGIQEFIESKLDKKIPDKIDVTSISEQLLEKIKPDINSAVIAKAVVSQMLEKVKDDPEWVAVMANAMVSQIPEKLKDDPEWVAAIAKAVVSQMREELRGLDGVRKEGETVNLLTGTPETGEIEDKSEGSGGSEEVPVVDDSSEYKDTEEEDSEGESEPVLSEGEREVVNRYNDKVIQKEWITDVTTTKDNVEKGRGGEGFSAIFERDDSGKGKYWVITGADGLYLVPNWKKTLNNSQMRSMQSCFECWGYTPNKTDLKRFKLVKPAKVSVVDAGERWQLMSDGKGILDFSG